MKPYHLLFAFFISLVMISFPLLSFAHEVYVLTPQEIHTALIMPSPNPFSVISSQETQFIIWGAAIFLLVIIILRISFFRTLQLAVNPWLEKLKRYAPFIGRLTIGFSLIASAYFNSLFGPELPLATFVGSWEYMVRIILFVIGAMFVLGLWTRWAALVAMIIFVASVAKFQGYMVTYVNYLGEMMVALLLGGGAFSIDTLIAKNFRIRFFERFEKYSFLILRILFGVAVFYASFYAKFLHSNLALDTVNGYHLTRYFHFSPLFVVLGAFLVEAMIGLFFAIGFEIRFTAIVFTVFLTLSILYFGEAVWPHVILFGINAALFSHGYDRYTIESLIFQKNKLEPIL